MILTRPQFAAKNTRTVIQNIMLFSSEESRDELRCYLNSLPLKVLQKAVVLMYMGRGDYGRGNRKTLSDILSRSPDYLHTREAALRKLMEKSGVLPRLLEKGLRTHDRTSLES